MKNRMLFAAFAVLTTTVSGCADKAQPKYDECVQLEGKGDLKGAAAACEAAVAASPDSKAGKAATDKLTTIKAAIKKQADEEAARAKAAAAPPPTASTPPPPPKPMMGFCAELDKWSLTAKYGMTCNTALDPGCSPGDNIGVVKNAIARSLKDPNLWKMSKRVAVIHVYATPLKTIIGQLTKARGELKQAKTDAGDKAIRDGFVKDYDDLIALAKKWQAAVNAYSGDGDFQAQRDDTDKAWAAYQEHVASRQAACEKLARSN